MEEPEEREVEMTWRANVIKDGEHEKDAAIGGMFNGLHHGKNRVQPKKASVG